MMNMKMRQRLERTGINASSLSSSGAGFYLDVAYDRAVEIWDRLRGMATETGFWPVLIAPVDPGEVFRPIPKKAKLILARAATIDPAPWFREARARNLDELASQLAEGREVDWGDDEMALWLERCIADGGFPRGDWPEDVEEKPTSGEIFSVKYPTGDREAGALMRLALVPTCIPWEVPAHLNYGGWNDCPSPAEQVAIMKYWHDRHGAEVMTIAGDVVEMAVARPPSNRSDAIAIAEEKFLYCEDIVSQGCERLDALAAEDIESPVWFFWWD